MGERTALDATIPAESGAATAPQTSCAPLSRGARVDRYIIEGVLGTGGMGIVYRARDPELGRPVALKLVRPEASAGTPTSVGQARLLREAQSMARLAHPNTIAVFDVGTTGEQVFVAMELIDGMSMSAWLRESRREWHEVLRVMKQAGRGLEAAHAAGLVHRDFKPENVLIGRDGRVRVADLGLARATVATERAPIQKAPALAETELDSHPLGSDADLTRTGAVLGTPLYMAPEQHLGEAVDERSDQFSFCVALYEGLYGKRPFAGDTRPELVHNVLAGKLVDPAGDSRVPRWLQRVVLRGLSVSPAERFQSMAALLDALDRGSRRSSRAWLAAVVLVLMSFAAAVFALQRDRIDPPALPVDAVAEPVAMDRHVSDNISGKHPGTAVMAPSGHVVAIDRDSRLVVIAPDGAARVIHALGAIDDIQCCVHDRVLVRGSARGAVLLDAASLTVTDFERPGSTPDFWAALSPQGDRFATIEDGELVIRDVAGDRRVKVARLDGAIPVTVSFSPDGSLLALGLQARKMDAVTRVHVVSAASGDGPSAPLEVAPPNRAGRPMQGFVWLDSRRLAMVDVRERDGERDSVLVIAEVDATGHVERLGDYHRWPAQKIEVMAGRPDAILYARHMSRRGIHVATLSATGQVAPPAELESAREAGALGGWTHDGRLIYTEEGTTGDAIVSRSPDGEASTLLSEDGAKLQPVAIDHAAERILYLREIGPQRELWSCDAAGRDRRRITSVAADDVVACADADCFILANRDRQGIEARAAGDKLKCADEDCFIAANLDKVAELRPLDVSTGETGGLLATIPVSMKVWHVTVASDQIVFGDAGTADIVVVARPDGVVTRLRVPDVRIQSIAIGPGEGEYLVTTNYYRPIEDHAVLRRRRDGSVDVVIANRTWYYGPHIDGDRSRVAFEGLTREFTVWSMPVPATP